MWRSNNLTLRRKAHMRKRLLTRLGAVAVGGVFALAAASPALAEESPSNFNQEDKLPIAADDAEFKKCEDDRWDGKPDDQDGWHFVATSGSFVSISLTFQTDPDDASQTTDRAGTPEAPGDFIFEDSGPNQNHHATIFTPAGWLLVDASAVLDGANFFVLSNSCPGTPGDDPGEEEDPKEEEDPREEEEPVEEEDPELPVTGAQLGGLLVLAGGLLAAGAAMLFVRRRRNLADMLES
jgi:LPXTG-motif cell wall-anchored protein